MGIWAENAKWGNQLCMVWFYLNMQMVLPNAIQILLYLRVTHTFFFFFSRVVLEIGIVLEMGPKANKNTHTDWVSHILHLIVHIQEHTKQHEQICHQQQSHMHGLHVQQLTNIRFVLNKHGRKYTHMHSAAEKAKRHNSLWSCPVCLQVSQLKVESRRGHAQTYTNNHTCIHTYLTLSLPKRGTATHMHKHTVQWVLCSY